MTGEQAKSVIFAPDGLLATLPEGSAIVLSATITPQEARDIGAQVEGSGVHLIDSPVSGGFPGAQGGQPDAHGRCTTRNSGSFPAHS